jgi:hypothetical protein
MRSLGGRPADCGFFSPRRGKKAANYRAAQSAPALGDCRNLDVIMELIKKKMMLNQSSRPRCFDARSKKAKTG